MIVSGGCRKKINDPSLTLFKYSVCVRLEDQTRKNEVIFTSDVSTGSNIVENVINRILRSAEKELRSHQIDVTRDTNKMPTDNASCLNKSVYTLILKVDSIESDMNSKLLPFQGVVRESKFKIKYDYKLSKSDGSEHFSESNRSDDDQSIAELADKVGSKIAHELVRYFPD